MLREGHATYPAVNNEDVSLSGVYSRSDLPFMFKKT